MRSGDLTGTVLRILRAPCAGRRLVAGRVMRSAHLLLLGLIVTVAACTPIAATHAVDQTSQDIHERLSDAIAKAGFSHRIISDRSPSAHLDSIHLRIPLDGMKRRHEGVERVLTGIARVCALPEYESLSIRIVVATVDEEDAGYLRAALEHEVGRKENISIKIVVGSGEGIVIAVNHPPRSALTR